MNFEDAIWLILSVLGIFTIVIVITRISGLRTFAKMSSFDFASTIAIGSVLASIVLNTSYSLTKGAVVLAAIIGYQTFFSYLVRKSNWFKKISTNKPQLIMRDGVIFYEALKRCNIGVDDLIAKLREANAHNFSEVKAVIFESTGDISVLHNNDGKDLSEDMLTDVKINTK